jgi:hypothetical protein
VIKNVNVKPKTVKLVNIREYTGTYRERTPIAF